MGRLIIQILKRVDLRGVVEQILVVLAAVEIEGVVVARLRPAGRGLHTRLALPFFVLLDILGIGTGQLGGHVLDKFGANSRGISGYRHPPEYSCSEC